MKIKNLKNKIENATIAIATVDNNKNPHNIAIMYAKVKNNKIIITNNYMNTTINNLKSNKNISLVFWEGENGWGIDGEVEYHDSGNWLEFVKSLPENKNEPTKGAVVISVNNIRKLG